MKFGPISFSEEEICRDQGLIVIEHDQNYCRVDELKSCDELKQKENQDGQYGGFFNCHQLADSLMRGIAFKLGKVDKFGA